MKANDQIVYDMYNKYQYLLEELDIFREKLLDNIVYDEGDIEKPEPIENLTAEQKDYKLYIIAKELSLKKWNSSLQGQVQVLKENNFHNNIHIREQKVQIDDMNKQLEALDENGKVLRDSLKDFKAETKMKIQSIPKDNAVSEIVVKGELNPINNIVIKLTKHIKNKIEADIQEIVKGKEEPFDYNIHTKAIKELSLKLNDVIIDLSDKAEHKLVKTTEESLKELILSVKNKTQIKITSVKELAEDNMLNQLFTELISEKYSEYERKVGFILVFHIYFYHNLCVPNTNECER